MINNRLSKGTLTKKEQRKENVSPAIVHLGIGAFHRAHQAVYTNSVNEQSIDNPWYILGVSLRSSSVAEQLNPQDGYYSLLQTDAEGVEVSVVKSVSGVLVAPQNPEKVLLALTSANTKIISLTITEKGYCHDPATGQLDRNHPDICHDLENLIKPKTAIGYLVASLKRRNEEGIEAPTILCCDNLPNNGDTLAKIVIEFASLVDDGLALWIKSNVSFPNTMVDRIVPATTESDVELLESKTGYQDLGMVKTERFTQWVIENKFSNIRPKWESVGAMLVEDVEPFENAKLRMLNGTHSALAYLGYLSGYEFVHQVMADKDLAEYVQDTMLNEIIPTLEAPPGLNLIEYSEQLLNRYRNPALNHKTYQIAMDGSQKMPQRILHTIEHQLKTGGKMNNLVLAVAGWLRYTMSVDEQGRAITVQDPLSEQLLDVFKQNSHDLPKLVESYLSIDKVFSKTLQNSIEFKQLLLKHLSALLDVGVSQTLNNIKSS